jgi:hypothetical protein
MRCFVSDGHQQSDGRSKLCFSPPLAIERGEPARTNRTVLARTLLVPSRYRRRDDCVDREELRACLRAERDAVAVPQLSRL